MVTRRISKKARDFISRKIRKLIREGVPPNVAVGRAFSDARKRGFKVPTADQARMRREMKARLRRRR